MTHEEKVWLNKFTEEFTNAKFKTDEKENINKGKHKLSAYGHNNARNRCQYSRAKAQSMLTDDYVLPEVDYDAKSDDYENFLIDMLEREYIEPEEEIPIKKKKKNVRK